jgi:hypothetical protein
MSNSRKQIHDNLKLFSICCKISLWQSLFIFNKLITINRLIRMTCGKLIYCPNNMPSERFQKSESIVKPQYPINKTHRRFILFILNPIKFNFLRATANIGIMCRRQRGSKTIVTIGECPPHSSYTCRGATNFHCSLAGKSATHSTPKKSPVRSQSKCPNIFRSSCIRPCPNLRAVAAAVAGNKGK